MNIVRLILKEAGGRMQNAAGAIKSDSNMFEGSSGNAPSDKLGSMVGGGNANPTITEGETEITTPETTTTENVEVDTDSADKIMSDEKLKGKMKDFKLSLTPKMNMGGGMGGNLGAMGNMFQGIMSAGGDGADMGADAGDMADAAEAASDERLKNIFGDNEDAIKAFAKINAIEFKYNDKAHEIPGGEEKGIDDDTHYGVKAQELAQNPFTESAVSRDPISDYLQIDVKELTTANTAIISEICKRILIIEKVLGIKVV